MRWFRFNLLFHIDEKGEEMKIWRKFIWVWIWFWWTPFTTFYLRSESIQLLPQSLKKNSTLNLQSLLMNISIKSTFILTFKMEIKSWVLITRKPRLTLTPKEPSRYLFISIVWCLCLRTMEVCSSIVWGDAVTCITNSCKRVRKRFYRNIYLLN